MLFENEILKPRIVKGLLWTLFLQEVYLAAIFLLLKSLSLNPLFFVSEWLFYLFHWKMLIFRIIVATSTLIFGMLHREFCSVEKHICSTRCEKIVHALSSLRILHLSVAFILGGLVSYCLMSLFYNFDPQQLLFLSSSFVIDKQFEIVFVVVHGCYTGLIFSLKYFICYSYIVKLNLEQVSRYQYVKKNMLASTKESAVSVLKAIIWFYPIFKFIEPLLHPFIWTTDKETSEGIKHFMNYKMFLVTYITGLIININWNLCLCLCNLFLSERYIFPIEAAQKNEKDKVLPNVLACSQSQFLRYFAVIDLRIISQFEQDRRKQIFSLSYPGGHPHNWKAISELCIDSLKNFTLKLNQCSFEMSTSILKAESANGFNKAFVKPPGISNVANNNEMPSYFEKCIREWSVLHYFCDKLPNIKIRQLFTSSRPLVWMTDALGYLVSASYTEDKFGVVQQTLPSIIQVLFDLKMAEEKLLIDSVGFKLHVNDPLGPYEHVYERSSLKIALNNALYRIANAFKDDINEINLPSEYHRYFQRYLNKKII